jgi:hypothetical protein
MESLAKLLVDPALGSTGHTRKAAGIPAGLAGGLMAS